MKSRSRALIAGVAAVMIGIIAVLGRGTEQAALPADARADSIIIDKGSHTMTLFSGGQPLRSYAVSLGRGGLEGKTREGDNRTPDGRYRIDGRNPRSAYHLSLRISYPDARDLAAAAARGDKPGGDIMIHGIRNGLGWLGSLHRWVDWTAGCVAVTDAEIEEIWRVVPDGTPVEISVAPLQPSNWPTTMDAAVNDIISRMQVEDKEAVRKTKEDDLILFHHGWGTDIRNHYGLWRGNAELAKSACGKPCHPDDASMNIIEAVWRKLQE